MFSMKKSKNMNFSSVEKMEEEMSFDRKQETNVDGIMLIMFVKSMTKIDDDDDDANDIINK